MEGLLPAQRGDGLSRGASGGRNLTARAAQIACCSTYHFQRMFPTLRACRWRSAIRRRRLTLRLSSCRRLVPGDRRGAQVWYESPEAFSRAFKNSTASPPPQRARQVRHSRPIRGCPLLICIQEMFPMQGRITQRRGSGRDAPPSAPTSRPPSSKFPGFSSSEAEAGARLRSTISWAAFTTTTRSAPCSTTPSETFSI